MTSRVPTKTNRRAPAPSSLRFQLRIAGILLFGVGLGGSFHSMAAREITVGHGGEFTEIQAAIDHAIDGDTVLVGSGEYFIAESLTFRGKRITLKSEEGPRRTTIRMSDERGDARRATVVVFVSGEDRSSVLAGFTLTGGRGVGGGGIYGGGVYCAEGTAPILVDCTMTRNRAVVGGGVHSALGSSPMLVNCRILRNVAGRGGGIFAASNFPTDRVAPDPENPKSGASPTLVNCQISQNRASSFGGGAFFDEQSSPTVTGCLFTGNSARVSGGGVFAFYSLTSLAGCTIAGNSSGLRGGGLYVRSAVSTFVNCVVTGNRTGEAGGGVFVANCFSRFLNCTITGNAVITENDSIEESGGIHSEGAAVHLTNSIVWNNLGGSLRTDSESRVRVSHSSIEAGQPWLGPGNIKLDPRFEREGFYDFTRVVAVEMGGELHEFPDYIVEAPDHHLRPDSPAVDTGTLARAPDADIEGNVRPCGVSVDMGAFEMGDCPAARFLRGDCNGDAKVDLADAVCTLNWLFAGGEVPGCLAAANTNGDDAVNLPDAIHLFNFLFAAGAPPAAPYPACAASRLTGDRVVGCENPPADCN